MVPLGFDNWLGKIQPAEICFSQPDHYRYLLCVLIKDLIDGSLECGVKGMNEEILSTYEKSPSDPACGGDVQGMSHNQFRHAFFRTKWKAPSKIAGSHRTWWHEIIKRLQLLILCLRKTTIMKDIFDHHLDSSFFSSSWALACTLYLEPCALPHTCLRNSFLLLLR